MSKKQVTHEKAEHDEVAEGVHEAFIFMQRYAVQIILLLVILTGLVLVRVAMVQRSEGIRTDVNRVINEALGDLNEIEAQTDLEQRRQAVDQLVARMDNLVANYSNQKLAAEGLFLKGRAYYDLDRFDEAQQAYQAYIDTVDSPERQARGNIALGYAYENQSFLESDPTRQRGLVDAGMGRYEQAAKLAPGTYLYFYALLGQARLYELTGRNEEAMKLYQQVIDERPLPSAAVAAAEQTETKDEFGGDMIKQFLQRQLNAAEAQMSFRATAELRLARLQARAGEAPVAAATETPAPVATP